MAEWCIGRDISSPDPLLPSMPGYLVCQQSFVKKTPLTVSVGPSQGFKFPQSQKRQIYYINSFPYLLYTPPLDI